MVPGMLCAQPAADRRTQEGSKFLTGCPQLKVVKAPAVACACDSASSGGQAKANPCSHQKLVAVAVG